ncbi:MAG TPA: cytochrome c oxidase assembly protein [Rhizomicrobium sp.]|jgi:putative membrane protein|nr:cytochrome c oxidase assembly protein [Rhizomicrobium sp.]
MRSLNKRVFIVVGVVVVLVVIFPPLAAIAQELFAAHMMQHLLLIAVAAPLVAASRNTPVAPPPVWCWIAFVTTFLFWHWPTAFQWAARSTAGEFLELASIFFTAFLFWSAAFATDRLSYGARALFVMTGAVATDLPGVIMVFAPHAICTMPGENASAWDLTPLQDQQIAGLLMWVPANLTFFAIATYLFARWMAAPSQHHSVTA